MSKKLMNIDEVDDALQIEPQPPSKTLAYFMWGIILFFWFYGSAVIALYITSFWPIVSNVFTGIASVLSQYTTQIIVGLVIIFVVFLLTTILYLKLLYKLAKELLQLFYIGLGVIFLIFGGIILAFGGSNSILAGGIMLGIGFIILILYAVFKERIKLVGRIIEVSAGAVYEEKGTIVAIILKSLFIAWTLITWLITLYHLTITLAYTLVPTLGLSENVAVYTLVVVGFILFFFGIWALYYLEIFFNAVIVRIIHDWYRSPEVDVAYLKRGFSKAFEVSGALAKFAILYATFYLIISAARSYARRHAGVGGIMASIVAWVFGIAEDVIRFLGFYVVPAMVIRRAGFKAAFKDSIQKLRDFFVETLAGSFAFGFVTNFIAILTAGILGIIGYFIGILVFSPVFQVSPNLVSVIGIFSGIIFFILALIPIGLATAAVSIAWKTILYEYGLDIEFAMKGIHLPARLPEDLKEMFNKTLEEKGLVLPTQQQLL